MFSILIVICNNTHVKAFDHVNISKVFKNLFIGNLFVCFIFIGWWCDIVDETSPGF